MFEKYFKLSENKTDFKTEIIAGLTTFMTMAYILFLNPNILASTGMDKNAVFFATAISAGFVTIAMGLVANFTIALAPGMGLNAFFAFTIVLQNHVPWQTALGMVHFDGFDGEGSRQRLFPRVEDLVEDRRAGPDVSR